MAELIITIDGPAGSGKSTVARLTAHKIGAVFLDTGAMYRAVTLAAMEAEYDLEDASMILTLIENTDFNFQSQEDKMFVKINGSDYTDKIRNPQITENVHFVACEPSIRKQLVDMQREFTRSHKKVVTEGRDQGTVVFPYADFKFYLIADETERARRRLLELEQNGFERTLEQVLEEIIERDFRDKSRSAGPLKPAEDAIEIDTTKLTIEQVVDELVCRINSKNDKNI